MEIRNEPRSVGSRIERAAKWFAGQIIMVMLGVAALLALGLGVLVAALCCSLLFLTCLTVKFAVLAQQSAAEAAKGFEPAGKPVVLVDKPQA